MWTLYILLCSDKSLYTGVTNNVPKRFLAHQKGIGAKYTRAHPPIRMIYTEQFETKSDAMRREAEIKSWPRAKKILDLRLDLRVI
jgi:putative endonuclease